MSSQILQQVRVVDPVLARDQVADVWLEAGQIRGIAPKLDDLPEAVPRRNAQGWVLGCGLFDLYSHSGEPGFESRETLASLQRSAWAGGFTRIALLPDTQPALDHPNVWADWQTRWQQVPLAAGQHQRPQLLSWGALTVQCRGQQLAELAELARAGVVGLADGQPLANPWLIQRLLEYAQMLDVPIGLVPWNADLAANGVMRQGIDSLRFGLVGSLAIAETATLAALLEIIAATNTPVHLMRISTARSVELIAQAKDRGLPVTASTTWMHLLLTSESVYNYDPNLRLTPPLGSEADREALHQGVRQGILDGIAIDHTPYTHEEKAVAFGVAPSGAIGLELALPLLWQNLVASGQWTALELWQALSVGPARCLRQQFLPLTVGQPAELVLFDPGASWSVDRTNLQSQANNTPWIGQSLSGRLVGLA